MKNPIRKANIRKFLKITPMISPRIEDNCNKYYLIYENWISTLIGDIFQEANSRMNELSPAF